MKELDHTPDTSFERDVVCQDEQVFCLSQDNIMALQQLLQQVCRALRQHWGCCVLARATAGFWQGCMLEHPSRVLSVWLCRRSRAEAVLIPCSLSLQLEARQALNKAACTELRTRIIALWERLQIPEEERQSSAVHQSWSGAKTQRAVRALLCSRWECWGSRASQ